MTLQEVRSEEFDETYNISQLMNPESLSVRQRHFLHNGTTRIRYSAVRQSRSDDVRQSRSEYKTVTVRL